MLVGAFACAHTPQLLARPGTEDRDLVLRVHAAFARVKRRLEALRADAIAIVAGDHVEALFLDSVPALAVYLRAECAATFGHYRYRFPIHDPSRAPSCSRRPTRPSTSPTRHPRRPTPPSPLPSPS